MSKDGGKRRHLEVASERAPLPWEQQPKESDPAFLGFRTYLERGPQRSIRKAANACGKNASIMSRWSSRWSWPARVRQFEQQATERRDQAHLEAVAERAQRQAAIAQSLGETLAAPAEELRRRLEENPELLKHLELPELLSLSVQASRAYNRVVVTERLARGMSTDNLGGHDGGPIDPRVREQVARANRATEAELNDMLAGVDRLGEREADTG